MYKNEPNRVDSERARKCEEIGPIPSLPAQFVEKWGLLQDGGMHLNSSDCDEILSAHFTVRQLPTRLRVSCCIDEPNKVDSERARKYDEIGPIPSLPAQFVEKWGLLQDGGMHRSSSDLGEILSAHFMVGQLPMRLRVSCCI